MTGAGAAVVGETGAAAAVARRRIGNAHGIVVVIVKDLLARDAGIYVRIIANGTFKETRTQKDERKC